MRTSNSVAIFDLDGTLFDDTHRHELAPKHRPCSQADWDRYHEAHIHDPIVDSILKEVGYYSKMGCQIFICTGRPEKFRISTSLQLENHNIPLAGLLMRPEGHTGRTWEVKREMFQEILKNYSIEIIFDDDEPTIKMAKEAELNYFLVRGKHQWTH